MTMGEALRVKRGGFCRRIKSQQNKLQDRSMSLTEDIDDTHGSTSPKQPSQPECDFFGIAGTLRALLLLLRPLRLGLSAGAAPNPLGLQ